MKSAKKPAADQSAVNSIKIVIDARMLGWTGVGRYTAELLRHLQAVDRTNKYFVLLNNRAYQGWQPINPNFLKVRANFRPYSLGEQLRLPRLLKKLKPQLVHFLSFNSPWLYRGRRISTIHDLTLLDFWPGRGLLSWAKYWPMRLVLRRAVKSSHHLLVPSQYVKQQLVRRYRINPDKVVVSYEAAELSSGTMEPVAELAGQAFLLYVGNAYPHKNLGVLVTAFSKLRSRFPKLRLVFCGRHDYFYQQLAANIQVEGVHFIKAAGDQQLRWLYAHAKLFVFPSLSEGFGLPGLEAMAQGLPVVAARASCLPEIYAQGADFFAPRDAGDLAKVVTKLLNDNELRRQLGYRGQQQAHNFSWSKTARITLETYAILDT